MSFWKQKEEIMDLEVQADSIERSRMKITLKAARINAGLTQKAASERIGVSEQTLSSWERCRTYPNVLEMEKMRSIYALDDGLEIEWRLNREV